MRVMRHAPAKINLCLYITGRRDDGYHLLDSVMGFTKWGDTVTVETASAFGLTVTGPMKHQIGLDLLITDKGSPNLIVRAIHAMCDMVGKPPLFRVTVDKHIPVGAGLGGGSSGAAAVMHAVNEIWGEPLSIGQLCDIGVNLGAEMPVCLRQISARVQGIGDIITPLFLPDLPIVIVWPEKPLLTKDVFDVFSKSGQGFDEPLQNDLPEDMKKAGNSLTSAAISLCPEINGIIEKIHGQNGCKFARMSGSGSACFGVFNTHDHAIQAAKRFPNAIVTIAGGC